MNVSMRCAWRGIVLSPLLIVLAGCPPEKDSNIFAPPAPLEAPVSAVPVPLEALSSQIPKGIESYQAVKVEWEGMKPARAIFERFVRGTCFVQAHYVLAEGGVLVQAEPFYESARVGKALAAGELLITRAIEITGAPDDPGHAFQRDPVGKIAWVWAADPVESIWTFRYPEDPVCVAPAAFARDRIPAKIKPTRRSYVQEEPKPSPETKAPKTDEAP